MSDLRIGFGYDAHRLVEDRPLILGGITLPYPKGLLGHSDADVLTHALMDAMLGALSLGTIGDHFPDNDAQYKDISSIVLLDQITALIHQKGYKIQNCDCVVVAQEPKIKPYTPDIQAKLAHHLHVEKDRVCVKGTTTEQMGFEGRKEGISAHVVVLLTTNHHA